MEKPQANIRQFSKGEVIFRQGSVERSIYKIIQGQVSIYSNYQQEGEILLTTLEKDTCFGEMAALEKMPRSASAVALVNCAVMVYPEHMLPTFVHQNPQFALSIMRNLSASLRRTTSELEKTYELLQEFTQPKKLDQESITRLSRTVEDYISRYTRYDEKGNPYFHMT